MIQIGDSLFQNINYTTGWVCPKCGRVYSPSTPMCSHCGGDEVVTNVTTDMTSPPHLGPTITTGTIPKVTYTTTSN